MPSIAVFSQLFALLLLGYVGPAFSFGQAVGGPAPRENADLVRRGVLSNGVHYIILPHASPRGDASLRLVVQAGSLDERDDERGFAHFVEHLAFTGTRKYPASSIRLLFQSLGLTLGPDINATTSYTHTTYMFDLADGQDEHVDTALSVLRDIGDGILFVPEQLKREAGVVNSEIRSGDGLLQRIEMKELNALYAGTRLPERDIAGVLGQLEHATPEKVRAFYQRNYQAGRMTVIAVGPFNPDTLAQKISSVFGGMAASREASPPAALAPPQFAGPRPLLLKLPDTGEIQVELIHIGVRPPDTTEGRRQELMQRLAIAALHARLRNRREAADDYDSAKAAYRAGAVGNLAHHVVTVNTGPIFFEPAIQLAETEIRRAATTPFTSSEIDRAVAAEVSRVRDRNAALADWTAARIGGEIADAVTENRAWRLPEMELAEVTRATQAVASDELQAAIREMFPAEGLNVVVIAPPANTPKPERVLTVYRKSASHPLRQNAPEEKNLVFAYQDFGPAGKVVARQQWDDLGLTTLSFANDVRLNLRPSTLEAHRFRLRIVFPEGLTQFPGNVGGVADVAAYVFTVASLRAHSSVNLNRLIEANGVRLGFAVNLGTLTLDLEGPSEALTFALQLVTAMVSELEIEDEDLSFALSRYAGEYEAIRQDPVRYAEREALRVFSGKDPRLAMSPPRELIRHLGEASSWLTHVLLRGPLEVGMVGDFAVDDVVAKSAATLGTLKKRRSPPKVEKPLAAPQRAEKHEAALVIPAATAASCLLWPVKSAENPRADAALRLAADVLSDRMLLVVRETLGATYVAQVSLQRDNLQRDFAYVSLVSTFKPEKARQMTEGSIRLATQLAQKGVMPEEFSRLREPARARAAAEVRSNDWWLGRVAVAQTRPDVLEEARQHEKIFEEITLADVNAAAKVFQPDAVTAIIVRPPPGKASAGSE